MPSHCHIDFCRIYLVIALVLNWLWDLSYTHFTFYSLPSKYCERQVNWQHNTLHAVCFSPSSPGEATSWCTRMDYYLELMIQFFYPCTSSNLSLYLPSNPSFYLLISAARLPNLLEDFAWYIFLYISLYLSLSSFSLYSII